MSLAANDFQEGTNISFFVDFDGIPFVIHNSATCIICNDLAQFFRNLRAKKSSVETTHGLALADYVGTISIIITTNNGERMQYHIPNIIYNPNPPYNILGISFFGKFLGKDDKPYPTSDDVGTLKDGYICNVPFSRVQRIQSASYDTTTRKHISVSDTKNTFSCPKRQLVSVSIDTITWLLTCSQLDSHITKQGMIRFS